MERRVAALLGGVAVLSVVAGGSARAQSVPGVVPQESSPPPAIAAPPAADASTDEIIVTAQKREENVQNVGLSITAASGAALTKLGITDTAQLQKIIPGFTATPTFYGTQVFTIRGVGFQDTSLAGSPTVSTYVDESPLPYAALTQGATLDLERVEVLKGPQGTLFGENATGGAVNYIANKPVDRLAYGADISVGRFDAILAQGYVNAALGEGLAARLAVQSNTSGDWQEGYGPQTGASHGKQRFLNGRLSLLYKPDGPFRALLTLGGWRDRSDNQAPQLWGRVSQDPTQVRAPAFAAFPLAPHNDRAAGFSPCINTSPFDPIAGQTAGTTYPTPGGIAESEGAGSVVQAGGQPTSCTGLKRDNTFYNATLRLDYELSDNLTLTSLTQYLHFRRRAGIDGDGTPVQINESYQTGHISSFYQELRASGRIGDTGNWIVGGNYQSDRTVDQFLLSLAASTSVPFPLGPGLYVGLGPIVAYNAQQTKTYAAFASIEYPILDKLSVIGGIRYTKQNKDDQACSRDGGDGTLARLGALFTGVNPGVGGCFTIGAAGPTVTPYEQSLDQHNISWRAGLNYKPATDILLYATVSQGYKGGSYPTLTLASAVSQLHPVVQERLLSYEVGFKTRLFDRQLTLNAAGFYYDYHNKQILGTIADPLFGVLSALVNIPKSHVEGFEASATWTPHSLSGLKLSPSVSFQRSRIDGCSGGAGCVGGQYFNTDNYANLVSLTGQAFPNAPKWQASADAEYDWQLGNGLAAYVGGTVTYTASTGGQFNNPTPLAGQPDILLPKYTLLDLRAGVSKGPWGIQIWGRNITDKYCWTGSYHAGDALIRFAGMPATYGATFSYHY